MATVAVNAVMAVTNSKPRSEQHVKLSRFVESFLGKYETLKEKPQHAKWQEVNLYAPVAGWTRFPPAQEWLNKHPQSEAQSSGSLIASLETKLKATSPAGTAPPSTEQVRTMFLKFLQTRQAGDTQDREELFNQFVRWYQSNPN